MRLDVVLRTLPRRAVDYGLWSRLLIGVNTLVIVYLILLLWRLIHPPIWLTVVVHLVNVAGAVNSWYLWRRLDRLRNRS